MKTKFVLSAILCCLLVVITDAIASDKPFGIAIHGGAGVINSGQLDPDQEKEFRIKLKEALLAGHQILLSGGSSLDAVVKSITILEDSPLFNAGKGAVFTSKGKNELDASIMYGKKLQAGAVAGVTRIKNPILLSRLIMEKSKHVMLSGKGAQQFAEKYKLKILPKSYFHTPKRLKQLEKAKSRKTTMLTNGIHFGTVGAVALDQEGNLSAGTSTGGMTNKAFGRIGDSPIIGAGTYANNKTCAVSSTGHGEYFIRWTVAHDISAMMEYAGLTLEQATDRVVMQKLKNAGGRGGVIAIDRLGNVSMTFNTNAMFRACASSDGKPTIMIYENE